MNLRPRLRHDWKQWHKWAGMRLTALAGGLLMLSEHWNSIPPAWIAALPHWMPSVLAWGSIVSFLAGMGRRMTNGEGPNP